MRNSEQAHNSDQAKDTHSEYPGTADAHLCPCLVDHVAEDKIRNAVKHPGDQQDRSDHAGVQTRDICVEIGEISADDKEDRAAAHVSQCHANSFL